MNKLILTAALLALATPALADNLPPTDPLIGSWCGPHTPQDRGLFYRGSSCHDINLTINQASYSRDGDTCTFHEIKRIKNGIEIFSECYKGAFRLEKVTLQIIGGRLKINTATVPGVKPVTGNTFCLQVLSTPDGFLNLRRGPGMKFPVTAKLLPGESIRVDYQTDEWIHITGGCGEFSREDRGWVYKKYIEQLPDEDTTSFEPVPSWPKPAESISITPPDPIPGTTTDKQAPPAVESFPKWLGIDESKQNQPPEGGFRGFEPVPGGFGGN